MFLYIKNPWRISAKGVFIKHPFERAGMYIHIDTYTGT